MNESILKTVLWQQHKDLGAKLVEFAGYSMPINYGSQIKEHEAVRTDAGIFDVSHMSVIDIRGTDAKKFLSYLLANDVNNLGSNKALYSCMCNHSGGIIDDLIVYNIDNNYYRMVVNAATKEKDFAWLKENSKNYNIALEQINSLAILSVQGPNSETKLKKILSNYVDIDLSQLKKFSCCLDNKSSWFVGRTGYTGEDGFEVILPNADALKLWNDCVNSNIKPIGLGARDTLRLEAGMNLYGQDMDEEINPYECGLAWTVKLDNKERDFIGRTALENSKEKRKSNASNLQMIGLVLEERGVLRHGQKVIIENDGDGIITSGTFSPSLQCGIAMARVKSSSDLKNHDTCQVIIRDKPFIAKIVKYPFVRDNKPAFKNI